MLVLTRKLQERITIGQDITITVLRIKGNAVRIGIEAPRNVRVVRGELPRHASPLGPSSAHTADRAVPSIRGHHPAAGAARPSDARGLAPVVARMNRAHRMPPPLPLVTSVVEQAELVAP